MLSSTESVLVHNIHTRYFGVNTYSFSFFFLPLFYSENYTAILSITTDKFKCFPIFNAILFAYTGTCLRFPPIYLNVTRVILRYIYIYIGKTILRPVPVFAWYYQIYFLTS